MSIFAESFEALAFQRNNALRPLLIEQYQKVIEAKGDETAVEKALQRISDLVLAEIGILMSFNIVDKSWFFGAYEISVIAPNLNALSPVNKQASERLRKFDVKGMKITDTLNGTIDYKTGKVSGFYSKIMHQVSYSRAILDGTFPAAELAALALHEVGHAWTNMAYLGESLATNIVLAEIVGQYDMQSTVEKKFLVGKAALTIAEVTDELPEGSTSAELVALVLKGQVDRMQTAVGTRWYDHRLAETMADQFSIRFGGGADLVKALSRIERSLHIFAGTGYDPKWLGQTFNFVNIVMIPYSIVGKTAVAASVALISSISKSFCLSFFISGVLSESVKRLVGSAHAPIGQRLASIRREVVAELRNPNLPDETRKLILADLEVIDTELLTAHPFTDVYSQLSRYLADVLLGRRKEFARHNLVEDLANNRLYEFSAALKG